MSMNFVLVPGAGGDAHYWHLVTPLLREAGHRVVAPDLPAEDDAAGLGEYANAIVAAAATASASCSSPSRWARSPPPSRSSGWTWSRWSSSPR